jgi:hypothetical protein
MSDENGVSSTKRAREALNERDGSRGAAPEKHSVAPFVEPPAATLAEKVGVLEVQLQSDVKLLREEAMHRMERQSKIVATLKTALEDIFTRNEALRSDLNEAVKAVSVDSGRQSATLREMIDTLSSDMEKTAARLEDRVQNLIADIGTMTGLFNERDDQILHQFDKIERRFAAFESALHHLEDAAKTTASVSETEGRRLEREKAMFDGLETMQSRLEEMELTVGRMRESPLTEITAQLTALRNGQALLKEQFATLERGLSFSNPAEPDEPVERVTPVPLARVRLATQLADVGDNEPSSAEMLTEVQQSLAAFEKEQERRSK